MVAGCGSNIIKYILFFFNVLFFLIGAAAVGVGIWALVDKNYMVTLSKVTSDPTVTDYNIPGLLQSGAIILIVGGGVLVVMGFLGCCGAVKEIKCMLCMYATLLVLVLIVEVIAGILVVVMKNKFEVELKGNLVKNLETHYDGQLDTGDTFSRAIDWAQVYFDCCGINSYKEFENTTKWTTNHTTVPVTCCVLTDKDKFLTGDNTATPKDSSCPTAPTDTNSYKQKPCYPKIRGWLVKQAVIIIAIAFAIAALEIFGILFACCLIRAIKEDQKA